ncbi:uncharacterized protein LOC119996583 isoform X2 [Tripterygium wilfordii]|uniref:uncharacterized protein LOC119996583 isoform X2 n=1 Tax=Tripterygium wilfordii TaxID=458696 RepID=UPI0018F83BE5|nr:uncharacterized protein LOC119996583 isoform X2 [Tripterygium wilfordii]
MALAFPPTHFSPQVSFSSSSPNSRPAVILPGLGNNSGDYKKLQETLKDYGVSTVVAKVSRYDWLRNAAGLVDPNYWKGTLEPRPVLDWYLKKIHDAVEEAKEQAQGGSLALIGHSAGGWLARVYLEGFGLSNISLLLTLGTPHLPPPKGLPGVIDQTRGLLYYVEENCPKPVNSPQLKYVCIAGRYIQGARFLGNVNVDVSSVLPTENEQATGEVAVVNSPIDSTPSGATLRARFIGQGYKQEQGRKICDFNGFGANCKWDLAAS